MKIAELDIGQVRERIKEAKLRKAELEKEIFELKIRAAEIFKAHQDKLAKREKARKERNKAIAEKQK